MAKFANGFNIGDAVYFRSANPARLCARGVRGVIRQLWAGETADDTVAEIPETAITRRASAARPIALVVVEDKGKPIAKHLAEVRFLAKIVKDDDDGSGAFPIGYMTRQPEAALPETIEEANAKMRKMLTEGW